MSNPLNLSTAAAPAAWNDTPDAARQVYDYALLDVFAEAPLTGNPLAVFCDARGLSAEQMQALARETNLSETAFILPRPPAVERKHGVQARIFTPREELPFAGHPTLGTATWLYLNHPVFAGAETIALDLRVGRISVSFPALQKGPGIFGAMRQNDPVFGQMHDRAEVARAIGISVEDLDPELPIQTVSTGMPFCIVPLRSLEVAARLAIPQQTAQPYLARVDAKFFYCIVRADAAGGAGWRARMQFYNGEDPATGSASGCAIAYLVRHSLAAADAEVVIEQGIEMLRPSRIYASASRDGDRVCEVRVSGRTIPIASGRFFLS